MNVSAFEDLLMTAVDRPDKATCCELTKMLESAGDTISGDISGKLELLWEGWSGSLTDVQAAFCIFAASRGVADTPVFRKVFSTAVKRLLPPYLSGAPVMRALGVRDDKKPPVEVAARLNRLMNIKVGTIIFLPSTRRWALAGTIDPISGTLPVSAFAGSGSASRIPLEIILPEAILINPGTEVSHLIEPLAHPMPAAMFRSALERRAVFPISADEARLMAQCGCARTLGPAAFEEWWNGETASAAARVSNGGRRSCDGRSVKEMALLLTTEEERGAGKFGDDEIAAFTAFFQRMKVETAIRDEKQLAEVVGSVCLRLSEGSAAQVFAPLIGKAPFWPANPSAATLLSLVVWGELSAKALKNLSDTSFLVLEPKVLNALVMKLPLKALNTFIPHMPGGALLETVCNYRNCGADIMIWVWKNRKKLPDRELIDLINIENVIRTLSSEEPPKEWGPARRELRALLMDNAEFQTRLLEASAENTEMVCTVLQSAFFLSTGERQSLTVKLAQLSPSLRSRLESGAGSKIVGANAGNGDEIPAVPRDNAFYTSARSFRAMEHELEDIVNVQIPENREALKTARAHGDFRENSEFDAAKERRNHLNRRRNELERDLANVHQVLMRQVQVSDEAVIGSEIELKYDDGAVEVYQLLGAWDGDPQRKFLSYRARLGAAVLHHKVGDTFNAPGDRKCTLVAVRELSDALKAELDD